MYWLLLVYCLLIAAASMAGGVIPIVYRLTHTRMQIAISFVAGLMLGVGLLHMLPHSIMELGTGGITAAVLWTVIGFLLMFFLQRFFHYHHHGSPEEVVEAVAGHDHEHCDHPSHDAAHRHGHSHDHSHSHAHGGTHRLSWSGAALGLTLHSLVDGIALASAVKLESQAAAGYLLVGIGPFLAVLLHKPFDSLTITTLMTAGGWSIRARYLVNAIYASIVPLGVLLFIFGVQAWQGETAPIIGRALAFSAGAFLCIATSDLLPEVQFHSHDRGKLSAALILGVALAWFIETYAHDHAMHAPHNGNGQHQHDH